MVSRGRGRGRGQRCECGRGHGRGRGRGPGVGPGRGRGRGRDRDRGRGRGRHRNEYTSSNRTLQDSSPIVTRFFKILYDMEEDFSEHLYLPPAFAATVGNLLEQETYLEDSSGKRWTVTLSNAIDSLAFKKGWKEFFLSHGLKTGQVLEFHYIMGSHFVVHIFGTCGNEITEFDSREIINTVDKEIAAQDEPHQTFDVNLINEPISSGGNTVLDAEIQSSAQKNSGEKFIAAVKDTEH